MCMVRYTPSRLACRAGDDDVAALARRRLAGGGAARPAAIATRADQERAQQQRDADRGRDDADRPGVTVLLHAVEEGHEPEPHRDGDDAADHESLRAPTVAIVRAHVPGLRLVVERHR